MNKYYGLPKKQGLYDPQFEKDNCGVGFVAHMKGKKSHTIIEQGLDVLVNLTHRGAVGSDPDSGDGAGILIQIPHEFLKKEMASLDFTLPEEGDYGVGMIFLPQEPNARYFCEGVFEKYLTSENLELIGWRHVPVNERACGLTARGTIPVVHQIFIKRGNLSTTEFETKLYIVRKLVEKAIREASHTYTEAFYISSLSSKTMIYKGQLLARQIPEFYPDLKEPSMVSAIALVHQRYSTNTFPSWDRAQPFRFLAHNGEINTLRGNVNWMNAREGIFKSDILGEDIKKLFPIITPDGSDSMNLDNALELLVASGKSLSHAISMLIPEAWQEHTTMDEDKKAYYEYHAKLMEPWDGPAGIAFTDGTKIGATLDRNGLRPARYLVTDDNLVVMASETGVLPFESKNIIKKGRLEPGKMFLIDTNEGRIISDEEIKKELSSKKPYKKWVNKNKLTMEDLPYPHDPAVLSQDRIIRIQKVFGYTEEELKRIIAPMVELGKEAISSMGNDAPLAVLSEKPQLLSNYFKQLFAQVTNPPIDPIREKLVMSLKQFIGYKGNILGELNEKKNINFIELDSPILDNASFEKIRHIHHKDFRAVKIPIIFPVSKESEGLEEALDSLNERVISNINEGYNVIILSDRNIDKYNAPIPSLLATSSVHHHLIKQKLRTKVDIIVETGDARDVMHMALLIGYGATAVNPYVALDTIMHLVENKLYVTEDISYDEAYSRYKKAIGNGLLKILSKMGIGTLQSYHGAQIFEAVGINSDIINKYFPGTPSRIQGIGIDIIAKEVIMRHSVAFNSLRNPYQNLLEGGNLHWRKESEAHLFNPDTISKLQQSCKTNNYDLYKEYAMLINNQSEKLCTIRSMLDFSTMGAIPLSEVEPVENIVKRFATGAMSFGSLSKEVHETLALAMNKLGGKSNSGEGGEDPARFVKDKDGSSRNSAIKQVASGRFGVTAEYLVNAEEIQIKMAQGAKPGEGGHLPGHKVTEAIAKVRHSTPGIDLISPPPHHDIYSIEDLAQLIYDLKNINEEARINVKLVSEVGVGTVAAGVAKAHADVVLVSGHDGGTGASPASSIKYAGLPWELGLAETQQTLLMNDLRSRIIVQTDGQLKTGRDVAIAALLGAEEFGFATAALVVSGCIMMRKCQKNTCPVGVATQDPELRKHFKGKPEHLINFFTFLATELREYMAEMGFRTIDEMVGRVDMLKPNKSKMHWKARAIDFDSILYRPELPSRIQPKCVKEQEHGLEDIFDRTLISNAAEAIDSKSKVYKEYPVKNIHRSVGTMLAGTVAKKYGDNGLIDDTIHYKFNGSAGQSFGGFATSGMTLELEGDANDYLGKGLSGGKIIVYPYKNATFDADDNIIVGNTLLYGATDGEVYINGIAGERFAVRNSGATAVVEGVGDHGCEYMTGGIALILGSTGRNFGAGMSGGIAYVLDEIGDFEKNRCNYQLIITETIQDEDITRIKRLLENHIKYTNSEKAKKIISNFEQYKDKFIRVISPAYKEILLEKNLEFRGCR
ncbi:glutamate synthase large subunit [Vallitalea sp.]|jgi:glutamate synthase (NADPH/NADH) large chain|uniref:glutamate synthase large subunit n=1 Tax=Vallitalea sp. TaxID=1882829 RepID=UPI0025FBF9D1|nr:glutamate synthase large subunit [Vallitalea sp.]MCT4686793.1 glutamate synthase large subunit [Vallitalea sp.]